MAVIASLPPSPPDLTGGINEVAVLSAISEQAATLMDGVPTAYYYLLAHPDFDNYDLSSLSVARPCRGGPVGRVHRANGLPRS
ncbi:hypothetical protein ACQP2U_23555 [Nocardia sp. CA-084685]|uniref:hypothetical protein n=1 Tax=Nocardia sp. CA-084685 TaxID=3239970 RepID=UPI003D95C48F